MKKNNFNSFILFVFLFSSTLCSAQKSGHLSFGILLSVMPETKLAQNEMDLFQKKLMQQGEAMAAKFEADYASYVKDAESGNIAPAKQVEREEALEKQQQDIIDYEKQVEQQMEQKREQLLNPIVQKANKAIREVAIENGYEAVFDTSAYNAVLYAIDSDDLLPQVKSKLGI